MKNIAQHIENLLIEHDCVIVPGLGGFIVYQDTARIDRNMIHAPSNQIRFNQLLSYNDGLLVESYMKERKIGYNIALEQVNDDVIRIKCKIKSGNTYLLSKIGALSQTPNGNIILKNNNISFLPNNIGLPTVRLHKLSQTTIKDHKTIVLSIPKSTGNTIRYAAMITIVFILSILFPNPVNDTSHRAAISFDTLKNIVMPIKHSSLDIKNIDEPIIEKRKHKENLTKEINKASVNNNKYHLIVASLANREQAELYISSQNKYLGENLQIIECNDKYRISARSFSSYRQAITYMDSIKSDSPTHKKAWILCK